MPVKTWATNDVPTASDLNTQYRDQVISTVTSGTRPTGTEGQMIYETDTDLCYIYNGGWVRFGAGGGWTAYTPAVVQSVAVTSTVTYAKYEKIGRMVTCNVSVGITSAGTAANNITISLPFTAAASGLEVGVGRVFDTSAGLSYMGIARLESTTTIAFFDTSAAGASGRLGTSVMTAALASGDAVTFHAVYESST